MQKKIIEVTGFEFKPMDALETRALKKKLKGQESVILYLQNSVGNNGIQNTPLDHWNKLEWKDIFAWLPVETLVYENQQAYYDVLGHADNQGESTEFVEFMLGMIRDALQEISKSQNEHDVVINVAKNVVTNIMWRQFDVIFLWS